MGSGDSLGPSATSRGPKLCECLEARAGESLYAIS